jgi:hypothetical protein
MTRAENMTANPRRRYGFVTVALLLMFSHIAAAQTPCKIERGADPLDVLNSGVRHNV